MRTILETRGLTRRFGSLTAVDDVSFQVEEGEVFGLLGTNGAGKSTTIKMLTTLLPPTAGTATVAGCDIRREASRVRRRIGYVPQAISADGTLTGRENLLIFAKLYDVPRAGRKALLERTLHAMGLAEAADRLVRTYSGGMIRRLELAQSMLHHPAVLFLDEPTIGLDPLARSMVWEQVRRLRSEFGVTIFLTTHFMEEADNLCTRVAIMNAGRIVALDTPAALKAITGRPEATLDEVFIAHTGQSLESPQGGYRETVRTRRTAQRLG